MIEPDIYDEVGDIDDRAWKMIQEKIMPKLPKVVIYCTPKQRNLLWERLQKEARKSSER